MTVASDAPALRFADIGDAIGALRERGLRLSTSRRLVLEGLFSAAHPMSAEQLARGLSLDLTSVYRNLETLEHHGIARHVHLGHGPSLYTLVGRGEREYLYTTVVVPCAPWHRKRWTLSAYRSRSSSATARGSRTSRSSAPAQPALRSS